MTTKPTGAGELTRERVEKMLADAKELIGSDGELYDSMYEKIAALCEHYLSTAPAPAVAEPVAVYGYCPYCGARGIMRERRPNGDDRCENKHIYPSREALAAPPERTEQGDDGFDRLRAKFEASHPEKMKRAREWVKENLATQPTGASEAVADVNSEILGLKGRIREHEATIVQLTTQKEFWKGAHERLKAAQPNWREPLEALAERIESHYQFECEAGPLRNCAEWIELRATIEALAAQHGDGG